MSLPFGPLLAVRVDVDAARALLPVARIAIPSRREPVVSRPVGRHRPGPNPVGP